LDTPAVLSDAQNHPKIPEISAICTRRSGYLLLISAAQPVFQQLFCLLVAHLPAIQPLYPSFGMRG
jgi:hypothetical protein